VLICNVASTWAIRANDQQSSFDTVLLSEQELALSGETAHELEIAEAQLQAGAEQAQNEPAPMSLMQVASGPMAPPSAEAVAAGTLITQVTSAAAKDAATAVASKVVPAAATPVAKKAAEAAAAISGAAAATELGNTQAKFHVGQMNTYFDQYNSLVAKKQAEAVKLGEEIASKIVPPIAVAQAQKLAPPRSQEIFDRKHPQISENARTASVKTTLNLFKEIADADTKKHEDFIKQESKLANDLGKLYAQRASEHSLSQLKAETVRVATAEGEKVGATAILPYVGSLSGYADVLAGHAGDVAKNIANKAAEELQTRVKTDLEAAKKLSLTEAEKLAGKLSADSITQVVKQAQAEFIQAADATGKDTMLPATDAATEKAIQARVPDITKKLMAYVDAKLADDFKGRQQLVLHQSLADFKAGDDEAQVMARQVAAASAKQNAPAAASDAARSYLSKALETLKEQAKNTASVVAKDAKQHIVDTAQNDMNKLNDFVKQAALEAAKKGAFDESMRITNGIAEAQFRKAASDISNMITDKATKTFGELTQQRDKAFDAANVDEQAMVKQEATRVAREVARGEDVKNAITQTVTTTSLPILQTVTNQQISDAQQNAAKAVETTVSQSLKPIADTLDDAMKRAQINAEQAANTLAVDASQTAAQATATLTAKDSVRRLLHHLLAKRTKESVGTQAVDDATKAGEAAATAKATDIIITGASKKAIDDKVRNIAQNAGSQQAQKLKQESEETRYVLQDVADDVQEEDAVTRSLLEQIERRLALASSDPNYNATAAAQLANTNGPKLIEVTTKCIAAAIKEANTTAAPLATAVTNRYVNRLYNLIKNVYSRKYQAKMDKVQEIWETDKKIEQRLTESAANFFKMTQTDNNYFKEDVTSEFNQLLDQQEEALAKVTAYVNNAKVFSTLKGTMQDLAKAYKPDDTFSESQDAQPVPTLDHQHYDDAPLPQQAPSQQAEAAAKTASFLSVSEKITAQRATLEELTSSVDHLLLEAEASTKTEAETVTSTEDGVDMDIVNDIVEKVHNHYYDDAPATKSKSVTEEELDLASLPSADNKKNDVTGNTPNWLMQNYYVPEMKN